MNRKEILILLFLILVSNQANACICSKPESLKAIQDYEFENSEFILIGEVFKINRENQTFEIKVIESFKSAEVGKTYTGIYDKWCSPIVNQKGKWLIYGNYNSENKIKINNCRLTRSFKNPESSISATKLPKPLLPNTTESKTTSKKRMTKWKAKAKLDLKNKIIDLRKRTK